ncbi:MAG: hypothetical protein HON23_05365 [Rickettsiales bacterium]|jgi:hypothetical protein|nr:hypothetical protein [Rickettsiales bacterium]
MNITNKILYRVKCKGRGWVFTPKDFLGIRHFNTINPLLDRLEKRGEIRSLGKGLYDYPIFDIQTAKYQAPNLNAIIRVIEVQLNDRFLLSEEEAAYFFKISPDKPKIIKYLSNKHTKQIDVCGFNIKISRTCIPATKNKYDKATLAILAFKYLGKGKVTKELKTQILNQLDIKEKKKAIRIAKHVEWIHSLIRDL